MEKEARAGGLNLRDWILNAIFTLMVFAATARYAAAVSALAWIASLGALVRHRRNRTVEAA